MANRRPLRKLLVANRGEIALRIIRSAKLLDLKTVAIYSQADAGAAHTTVADEACLIGPAEASLSYLNIDAIIAVAKRLHADAIHPGYGFLSERAEFAKAVADAGLVFVGPSARTMATLGDKLAARRLAAELGVPTLPGGEAGDCSAARAFVEEAGLPILVKAAAGGGGRGMRLVEDQSQLDAALEAAAREAKAAFGDGRVFLEKFLPRPRHVEVQVLGDDHGGVIALGERDCSIQRRHQKIIEESPAPGLSESMRRRMAEAALALCRAAQYRSAGTVEFLVDGGAFYFLEVNARLQVEHPVTELRFGSGYDLVVEQLRIAAGSKIVEPPAPSGAAIECRIYAEDAAHDFRPVTGRVSFLRLPAGPGVRVDTHLVSGVEVSPYYDGLLAKVICAGDGREQARRRLAAALDEFVLLGVTNTAAFLRDLVASGMFARAELSTGFLARFFAGWGAQKEHLDCALIAAALAANGTIGPDSRREPAPLDSQGPRSPWDNLKGFSLWSRS